MRIAFHLAHPAHYHLFKNVIRTLESKDYDILVTFNDKDVLEKLLTESQLRCKTRRIKCIKNVTHSVGLQYQFIQKLLGLYWVLRKFRPDLVLGTSVIISLVGKILGYDSYIVNEDDFDIVQKTVSLGYPHATGILCPDICRTGNYSKKCITYPGYHELAYLHPNRFTPKREIVEKYISLDRPFFVLRFAKLKAHHDTGIRGLSPAIVSRLISILENHGNIYITSERPLEPDLEPYRIAFNPLDMHHILAFAKLYIGDSQTMAAEAGVLGTPFIRFNNFVGRISYLDELENKYQLGFGIKSDNPNGLIEKTKELLQTDGLQEVFFKRRMKMLEDKIDVTEFLTWFIENYPKSVDEVQICRR